MEEEIAEIVKRNGWFGANVFDNEPPFFYSIGLIQTYNHPEIIVFGMEPGDSYALLAEMHSEIRNGKSFSRPGECTLRLHAERRIGIRNIHPSQHPLYLGYAMGYCRHIGRMGELEAVQAFWPDSSGKYPFEVGCDIDVYRLQPCLDIPLTPSEIRRFERLWE
jgi:hypothetical protein